RGGFVEDHRARTEFDSAERAGKRDALPLASGKVGAALVSARENGVEIGEVRGPGFRQRGANHIVGRAAGRNVFTKRKLEADEILEHGSQAGAPGIDIKVAQGHAVDLDSARLRIVEPAQQL